MLQNTYNNDDFIADSVMVPHNTSPALDMQVTITTSDC